MFDVKNHTHLDFVVASSVLFAQTYGIKGRSCPAACCEGLKVLPILAVVPKSRDELRGYVEEVVSQVTVAPFVPQTGVTIHTNDSDAQAALSGVAGRHPSIS